MVKTQSAAVSGVSVERELQTTAGMRPHKLLLIDTDPKSAELMVAGLQQAGYAVVLSSDVEGALDQLERSQPDLILTHTRLPDMLGFQLVEDVRKDPKWSHIPVLLLSGDVRLIGPDGSRPEVEDYLIKPLDIKDVLARVQVLVRNIPRAEAPSEAENETRGSDSITIPRGFDPLEPVTGHNAGSPQAAPGAGPERDPAEFVLGASAPPSDGVFRTLDYALRGDDPAAKATWAPKSGRKRRKPAEAGRTLRGVSDEPRLVEPVAKSSQSTDAQRAQDAEPVTGLESRTAPRISASEIPESTVQERSGWVTGTQDVPTLVPSAEPPPARHESDIQVKEELEPEPEHPAQGAERPTIAVPSGSPAAEALVASQQTRALVEGARAELGLTIVETGSVDPALSRMEAHAKAANARMAEARKRPTPLQREGAMSSAFPLLLSDLPDDSPISIVPFPSDLRLLRDPRLRAHSPFPRDPRVPSDPRAVLSEPPLLSEAPQVTDSMFVGDERIRSKPVLPPNPRIPSNPVLPPNPRVPSNPAARPEATVASASPVEEAVTQAGPARAKRKRRRLRSLGFAAVSRPLNEEIAPREDQLTPAQGVPIPLLAQDVKRKPELNNLATVRPPPGLMLQIPMDALRSLPPEEGEEEAQDNDARPAPQKRRSAPIIVTLPNGSTEEVFSQAMRETLYAQAQATQAAFGERDGNSEAPDPLSLGTQPMPRPERELLATVRPSAVHGLDAPKEAPLAMVRVSTTWSGSPPARPALEQVQSQPESVAPEPRLRLPNSDAPRLPSTLPPAAHTGLWVNIALGAIALVLVVLLGVMLVQRASRQPANHPRPTPALDAPARAPSPSAVPATTPRSP